MIRNVHWVDLFAEAAMAADAIEFRGHGVFTFHYPKGSSSDLDLTRCSVCNLIYGILCRSAAEEDDVISACACSH
jgi:hypothetical protein